MPYILLIRSTKPKKRMAKIIKVLDSESETPFITEIEFNIPGQGTGNVTLIPKFVGTSSESEADATAKAVAQFEETVGLDVDWIRDQMP